MYRRAFTQRLWHSSVGSVMMILLIVSTNKSVPSFYREKFSQFAKIQNTRSFEPSPIVLDCQVSSRRTVLQHPITTSRQLREYAEWHRNQRKCLESNNCLPSQISKVLVWTCDISLKYGCHGLGDRLRGIAFAFLLAVATDRLFFIDWPLSKSAPFQLNSAIIPSAINWQVPENLTQRFLSSEGSFWYLKPTKVFIHRFGTQLKQEKRDPTLLNLKKFYDPFHIIYEQSQPAREALSFLLYNSALSVLKRDLLHQTNNNISVEEIHREVLLFLFRETEQVMNIVHQRTFPSNMPYIGLHARLGTDVSEGNLRGKRFGPYVSKLNETGRRLLEGMKSLATKHDISKVYLASDSLPFKQLMTNMMATDKSLKHFSFKTHFARALHVGQKSSTTFMANESERCAAFIDVFIDAYAIASAKAVVFFPSGFPAASLALGQSVQEWCVVNISSTSKFSDCGTMFNYSDRR